MCGSEKNRLDLDVSKQYTLFVLRRDFRTTHSHKRETTWCYRTPNAYLLLSPCKLSNLICLKRKWISNGNTTRRVYDTVNIRSIEFIKLFVPSPFYHLFSLLLNLEFNPRFDLSIEISHNHRVNYLLSQFLHFLDMMVYSVCM